jgi:hypothetical protein
MQKEVQGSRDDLVMFMVLSKMPGVKHAFEIEVDIRKEGDNEAELVLKQETTTQQCQVEHSLLDGNNFERQNRSTLGEILVPGEPFL